MPQRKHRNPKTRRTYSKEKPTAVAQRKKWQSGKGKWLHSEIDSFLSEIYWEIWGELPEFKECRA